MLTARTSQIEHWTHGELRGEDVLVRGMNLDTRKLSPGELFLALPGERVDGHRFVAQARQAGASAALVSRFVDDPLPQVRVADVQNAAGRVAAEHLRRHRVKVIAITGSNGKTTVKNLTAAILSQSASVLATSGNLNNELGLPLTLAKLGAEHRYAVLEMGAGKPGDIAYLCSLARPDVAIVNNVADAHIAQFGTRASIAETKGAIYAGLADNGIAVINADDAFASRFGELAEGRLQLRFGAAEQIQVVDPQPGYPQRFVLRTPQGERLIQLPLLGAHNRNNAAAAAALAHAAGASLADIAAGLAAAKPEKGRLALSRVGELTLVDDSYNANPASVAAALEAIAGIGERRWLVLGDMAELGAEQAQLHQQVGRQAADAGVERLYALGPLAALAAQAFGQGGRSFAELGELLQALRNDLAGRAAVLLVKGSRSAAMDRVCSALLQPGENACCSG